MDWMSICLILWLGFGVLAAFLWANAEYHLFPDSKEAGVWLLLLFVGGLLTFLILTIVFYPDRDKVWNFRRNMRNDDKSSTERDGE